MKKFHLKMKIKQNYVHNPIKKPKITNFNQLYTKSYENFDPG